MNNVLYSINGGLKNYQLVGLPYVPYKLDLIEKELSGDNHYGVLVDELYIEFVPQAKQKGKKYGVIRWHDNYDDENLKKIFSENKTVRFGAESLENIEKELDAIFA
ncbi:MAG: hypothetical protein KKB25_02940 [Nanoarchaeota archaeon]|nr:hypothetical protein [Nanoarchaeota archaeon]